MSEIIKVLIVEDLPTDAELCRREVRKALEKCQFKTVETRTEYITALSEYKPDIILSDYKLPSFDGMTALKIAQEITPETPFVLVTGSMNEDTAVACMKAGAWDYVIKEHIKRLGSVVLAMLEEKKQRRARWQADKDLKRALHLLEETQAVGKVGGWEYDVDAGHITWTAETYQIYGISQDDDISDLNKDLSYYVPEHQKIIKRALNRVVNNGEAFDLDLRFNAADGRKLWIRSVARPVVRDGRVVRVTGNMMDITERKLAEERIKLDELRLQELLELHRLDDKTEVSVLSHALITCTRSLQSQFAFIGLMNSDETVMTVHAWSKDVMDRCKVADKPMHFPITEAGLWGEVIRQRRPIIVDDYDSTDLHKKGYPAGHVPIKNFLSVPVQNESKIVAVAAVANKTGPYNESDVNALIVLLHETWQLLAEKKAEVAILHSKKLLQNVIDSTPDWLYVKDLDHRYLMVSRSVAEGLKIAPQEIIGKRDTDLFSQESCLGNLAKGTTGYHGEDQQAFNGRTVHNRNHLITWADGTQHIYDTYRIPLRNPDGNIYGALVYSRDITERKSAEDKTEAAYIKLQKTLDDFIGTMSKIIELRDPYTAGHQARVAGLSAAIADAMGLPVEQVKYIRIAALIHDIGKIYIPSDILSKPGKLGDIEWQLIRTHPQGSYDILSTIDFPWPVAEIALQHHERINGSGYPNKLIGDSIMLEAKILAVADVVEAMASHRPYRQALGIEKALEEINKNRGVLYDSGIVDVCLRLFEDNKFEFD